ncbi:MAG: peptidylprolyl isomerase [Candidatus Omnitrophica bacterium]|nr:peptidylprolyl isomerase [Candidatus Omnitrophota bacterium]
MKYKAVYLVVFTYLFVLSSGCAGRSDKEVLARIDQKSTITLNDFNTRIAKLPKRYQDVINKNKRAFLNELVVDVLLHNEALNKKLDQDKDVESVFEEAKKKILIARLLKDEVEDKTSVREEEITRYYTHNKEKFETPEVRRASHILVKTKEDANDILVELSNGRNFEDLARARSVDPTSKTGGDIGYFAKGQLVPEIEDICFNMDVGEISGVVKTKFGYHIIKLTETKEPRIKELEEVRDSIEQSLRRIKKKEHFAEFVDGLKEKSKITINTDLLDSISEKESTETAP